MYKMGYAIFLFAVILSVDSWYGYIHQNQEVKISGNAFLYDETYPNMHDRFVQSIKCFRVARLFWQINDISRVQQNKKI